MTDGATTVNYTVPASTNPRFDFGIEQNRAAFGLPQPTLTFSVTSYDQTGNTSTPTSPIVTSNPTPVPPTSLTITEAVEALYLSWTPPVGEDDLIGYRVYRAASALGPFTLFDELDGTTFSWYGTASMWFRVYSVDAFNQESTTYASANGTPKTVAGGAVDVDPPDAPTDIVVTPGFDDIRQQAYMDVSWTASVASDVRNYRVRSSTDNATYTYTLVPAPATTTRIDVSSSQDYYFTVSALDFAGNSSSPVAPTATPVASVADTTAPSTPYQPSGVGSTQQVMVSHNGKQSDNVTDLEPDTDRLDIYASTTDGFTTYDITTLIGSIRMGGVRSSTFKLPVTIGNETWYIKVKAVDLSGNTSLASAQATVVAGLIDSAHIADASITNAKITSLQADKITAGLGIIESLKIGNATTAGDIHSYNYAAGLTGWKIGGTSGGVSELEINDGTIRARTLELRDGRNLIKSLYAGFESRPSSYIDILFAVNGTWTVNTDFFKYGNQTATLFSSAGVQGTLYLGSSSTDYNQEVEASTDYILSAYLHSVPGTTAALGIKLSNGTELVGPTETIPADLTNTYTRFSTVITIPAGITQVIPFVKSLTNDGAVDIDGIQIEKKVGYLTTPSQWIPPGLTTVDGGAIKTGTIQSNYYVPDLMGWAIGLDGSAEFANGKFRGEIFAESGTFTGDLVAANITGATAIQGATVRIGNRITISDPFLPDGSENPAGGIIVWANDENVGTPLVRLHPNENTFDGKITAQQITVIDALRLIGPSSAIASGAAMKIENGVANPDAPTLTSSTILQNWPTIPAGYIERGITWDYTSNQWWQLLWKTANSRAYVRTISTAGVPSTVTTLTKSTTHVGNLTSCMGLAYKGTAGERLIVGISGFDDTGTVIRGLYAHALTGVYNNVEFESQWLTHNLMPAFQDSLGLWYQEYDSDFNKAYLHGPLGLYDLTSMVNAQTLTPETDWKNLRGISVGYLDLGLTERVVSATLYNGFVMHWTLGAMDGVLTRAYQYDFYTPSHAYSAYKQGTDEGFRTSSGDGKLARYSNYFPSIGEKVWAQFTNRGASSHTAASPESAGLNLEARRFATVGLGPAPVGIIGSNVFVGWGTSSPGTVKYKRTETITNRTMVLTSGKVLTGIQVARAITNKALTSNVATLTSNDHALEIGETIIIAGIDATFNGSQVITAKTTHTFSFAKVAANVASTATTGTATLTNTMGGSPGQMWDDYGNYWLGNGVIDLPGLKQHAANRSQAVAQTLTSGGGLSLITNLATIIDPDTGITYASGGLTTTRAGTYVISAVTAYSSSSTAGARITEIRSSVNGTLTYAAQGAAPSVPSRVHATWTGRLAVGETINLGAYQNSGGNLATIVGETRLSMTRISA